MVAGAAVAFLLPLLGLAADPLCHRRAERLDEGASLIQAWMDTTIQPSVVDSHSAAAGLESAYRQHPARNSSPAAAILGKALAALANRTAATNVTAATNKTVLSHPENIWNRSSGWMVISEMHPGGMISNVNGNNVSWANVNYINYSVIVSAIAVMYPVALVVATLSLAVLVSFCMTAAAAGPDTSEAAGAAASVSLLTPLSRCMFQVWSVYCRVVPFCMIFVGPASTIVFAHFYPQELFMVLMVETSMIVFSNGLYMVFYAPLFVVKVSKAMKDKPVLKGESRDVIHWLILPNYKEDHEILCGAIDSVAKSGIAKEQICLLLAMEVREQGSTEKAARLTARYQEQFKEIAATFHPPNLPNDPPGKASNVAWAYKWLANHVESGNADSSNIVLTVADADSDFHEFYFDLLSEAFVAGDETRRHRTLWQAPILHAKNYYRQPMLLAVGSMFTAMTEISVLSDPNAVRFPYSTYSLSLNLASTVGGWDPEWIAEDWHMGIKCFLFTLGQTTVEPIPVPTLNYVPEDTTWTGTLYARWAQAKRHALGISDMAYYFTMLPLIFLQLVNSDKPAQGFLTFMHFFIHGFAYVVRLVNTHVIIGNMTLYFAATWLLRKVMVFELSQLREIANFFARPSPLSTMFFVSGILLGVVVTIVYVWLYTLIRDRIENSKDTSGKWFQKMIFERNWAHWLYAVACFYALGSIYVFAIGACTWIAAAKLLCSNTFDYEVAAKPKMAEDAENILNQTKNKK